MTPLLTFLIAAASVASFANETTGPGRRHLLPGSSALGPAKRASHDPSPAERQGRAAELMSRPGLRFLMLFAESPSPAHALYGHRVAMMPDEVAGPFVLALVDVEVELARRYGLPFAQVCAETDLLLHLSEPSEARSAAWVLERLRHVNVASLGPAYDVTFFKRLTKVAVKAGAVGRPALADQFLSNLAKNLRRSARVARLALAGRAPVGDLLAQAFLAAKLPRERDVVGPAVIPEGVASDADTRRLRALRLQAIATCVQRLTE